MKRRNFFQMLAAGAAGLAIAPRIEAEKVDTINEYTNSGVYPYMASHPAPVDKGKFEPLPFRKTDPRFYGNYINLHNVNEVICRVTKGRIPVINDCVGISVDGWKESIQFIVSALHRYPNKYSAPIIQLSEDDKCFIYLRPVSHGDVCKIELLQGQCDNAFNNQRILTSFEGIHLYNAYPEYKPHPQIIKERMYKHLDTEDIQKFIDEYNFRRIKDLPYYDMEEVDGLDKLRRRSMELREAVKLIGQSKSV